MSKATDALTRIIDRKAYEWLEGLDPDVVGQIESLVAEGMEPDEIRKLIAGTCSAYDGDYADLCRSAARTAKRQRA